MSINHFPVQITYGIIFFFHPPTREMSEYSMLSVSITTLVLHFTWNGGGRSKAFVEKIGNLYSSVLCSESVSVSILCSQKKDKEIWRWKSVISRNYYRTSVQSLPSLLKRDHCHVSSLNIKRDMAFWLFVYIVLFNVYF